MAKFDEAVAEFQAAYELVGDPVILYNIAQSYRLAQQYEKALHFYKSYLNRIEAPKNREEVERRIAELTAIVEEQKRASQAPPTGTLTPDQEPQPEPPRREPAPAPAPPPPPPQPAVSPKTLRIVGYTLAGVAVASLAVGGAMSGLAANASSDVERAAGQGGTFTPELRDTESSGKTFDAVAIAGYVIGGAAAVGAAVTLALGFRRPAQRASLTPVVGPGTAGLQLGGRF